MLLGLWKSGQPHLIKIKLKMEKIEKLGSAKRFGSRYGSKPKHKFAKIEKEQRRKHRCPYCNNLKVKRVAVGIWHCRKCKAKFTGKAYSVSEAIILKASEEKASEEKASEELEEPRELEKVKEEVA